MSFDEKQRLNLVVCLQPSAENNLPLSSFTLAFVMEIYAGMDES